MKKIIFLISFFIITSYLVAVEPGIPTAGQKVSTSTVIMALPKTSWIKDAVLFSLNEKPTYAVIYTSAPRYVEVNDMGRIKKYVFDNFYIVLIDSGSLKIIDQVSLPINGFDEIPLVGFGEITVYDFTGDGNVDFAFSTYGASNWECLYIFGVSKKSNKLKVLRFGEDEKNTRKWVGLRDIWVKPGSIEVQWYAPISGRRIYLWDEKEEIFKQTFFGTPREMEVD